MDASFQNKLNELEARYKAKSESKQLRENVPHEINLSGSPLPRRPKPFGDLSFTRPCSAFAIGAVSGACAAPEASPSRLEHNTTPTPVASPAPSTPLALVRKSSLTPQNQSRSIVSPNMRDMSLFSPTCRNQNCGSPGARFAAAEAASPSRTLLDSKTSSPSSGGSGGGGEWMWRGGSARTPSPVEHGLGTPRIGSFGNLGGLQLNGQPRRRHVLNLPCSPQTPKALDSVEIEHKYTEIMKQAGILTINGQKVLTDISELQPLGELGHGTCGQVIKMVHTKTDLVMAVKQMRRSGNCEENKRIIMDLDVVVKSHNCPYIVQCIGTFITSTDVWICMELMATCLDKLLKNLQEPVPERILGKVTVATVNALQYLKENHGVIHRDVKPSNILLDERGRIKLCDFGISGRLVDSKAKTRSAGCAAYMAPERIDPPDPSKPDYDIRADVWSLGLSLVELATGTFPYKNCKTDFEVLTKVLQDDPPLLPSGWRFSMDFCSFVSQCLTKDYHRRPKYPKLLEHNFIKRYATLNIDVAAWYAEASRKIESKRLLGVDQRSTEQLSTDSDCVTTLCNFISPLGLQ